jgi:hypothetical protein
MLHTFEKNITRQSDDFEHAYTDTFLEINERLHADVRTREASRAACARLPAPHSATARIASSRGRGARVAVHRRRQPPAARPPPHASSRPPRRCRSTT